MDPKRIFLVGASMGLALLAVGFWLKFPQGLSTARIGTLCVKPAGGDGCFPTIVGALAVANPYDVILVAAGIYTGNILIDQTLFLEGGWNDTFTIQDLATFTSTIRPDDLSISVVSIQGQFGDPAAVAPTLDGFLITGGGGGNHGGGLRVVDSNALIQNNTIRDNVGYLLGGGIWVQRGAPLIQNNRIENNLVTPGGNGGGVELENSQATLIGNTIAYNTISDTVGYGGGIAIDDGNVMLINNTILGNAAANQTGSTTDSGYGGGISVLYASVLLNKNLIQNNTANSAAIDAHGFGGGIYISNSPAFTLTANLIMTNTGGFATGVGNYLSGGGILVKASQGRLDDNVLAGNRANRNTIFGNGGGLAAEGSNLIVQGGKFIGNSVSLNCEGYGGGLYLFNSILTLDATWIDNNCAGNTPIYGMGGGLAFINSPYTVTNALIINNFAFPNDAAVGGIYTGENSPGKLVNNTVADNNGQGIRTASPITVTNTIIMGHTTGISTTNSAPVNVTYNDFYANITNQRGFPLDFTNILINPQLDVLYHLTELSPAIDAGTRTGAPINDQDAEPRPMAGASGLYRIDIGADEFPGLVQTTYNLDSNPADFTLIGPGNPNDDSNGPNDFIGYAVMGNDINGDGKPDLMVSAEDWAEDFDNPPFATGRLFGMFNFGTRITGTLDLFTDTADLTVISRYILQHVGSAFASGDLNDDGMDDLIFGSFQDDDAGGGAVTPTVFTLWGGPALQGTRILTDTNPADFMLRAPGQDFFAYSAINALASGDVSGDGIDDLIVGDSLADDDNLADTGAVFVIFGSGTLGGLHGLATTPADFTLFGPAPAAGLGSLAIGTLNTGSELDLVARTDATAYILFGLLNSGAVHLGISNANVQINGLQFGGVTVMDFTGDGNDDLILGSSDKLYVIPGPFTDGQVLDASSSAVVTFTGATVATFASGDLVGDPEPDLIVGAPANKKVYVLKAGANFSGTISILDAAEWVVQGNVPSLGKDVAAGDLDLDGRPDLIVGTFGLNVAAHPKKYQDAGAVYAFYSTSPPPSGESKIYLPIVIR